MDNLVSTGSDSARSDAELLHTARTFLSSTDWHGIPHLKADTEQLVESIRDDLNNGCLDEAKSRSALGRLSVHVKHSHDLMEAVQSLKEEAAVFKDERDAANRELDAANDRIKQLEKTANETWFLTNTGDWCSGIHSCFKSHAKSIQDEYEKVVVLPHLEQGLRLRGKDLSTALKAARFSPFSDQLDEFLPIIKAEWALAKEWMAKGYVETEFPQTPVLHRAEEACEKAVLEIQGWLEAAKTYAERNDLCHKKPPVIEGFVHADPADNEKWLCDWEGFEKALSDAEKSLLEELRRRNMSADRQKLLTNILRLYRLIYICRNSSGDGWIGTKYGERCLEEIGGKINKSNAMEGKAMKPTSLYRRGRFDRLSDPGTSKVLDSL